MKRPMLYWAVLFILGEVVCRMSDESRVFSYVIAMTVVFCFVMVIFRCNNNMLLWIGAVFFFGGIMCFNYQSKQLKISEHYQDSDIDVEGTILQCNRKNDQTEYIVKTKRVSGEFLHTKIIFSYDGRLTIGSKILIKGRAVPFSRASNPGQYDEKQYRNGKGIFLKLNNVSCVKERVTGFKIRDRLYRLHTRLLECYESLFDKEQASLTAAMVLGDKAGVDEDVKKLYQRNGIAHLIAISGLHIAMIGGTLYHFFRRLFGSYSAAAVFGICFIVSYGVMTGLSESTLRAMIMLITQIGADVFGRKYDGISAICLALAGMLFFNPFQIDQAGFLLSFGAVIGISLVNPVWEKLFGKTSGIINAVFLSVSVQLTIFPIMLYFFYEIPLYGFILNLIVVPLMGVLLFFLILCGLTGLVCAPAAGVLAIPAKCIFELYEMLCRCSEMLPLHTLCIGRPPVLWILCYYALLSIFVWTAYRKEKSRYIMLVIITACILLLSAFFNLPSDLKICMFDVGQGDGIYVRTPGRLHILIDGGSSTKKNVGTYIIKNGIRYYGAKELDYVVVSHIDSDHYSGVYELLESGEIKIKNLVLPDIANPDDTYHKLEDMGRKAGCEIIHIKKGDCIKIGEVSINCLNPEYKNYSDKNEGCTVLQLNYGDFDMLFTGDMTSKTEQEIYPYIKGSVEVLKVAHHGSDTSSGQAFISALSPKLALVSVGAGNMYGHPSSRVLEVLGGYCDNIYLTKDCGAITIDSDEYSYSVSEFLSCHDVEK